MNSWVNGYTGRTLEGSQTRVLCPHGAVLLPSWHVDVSRRPPDPVLWGFCAGFVT